MIRIEVRVFNYQKNMKLLCLMMQALMIIKAKRKKKELSIAKI